MRSTISPICLNNVWTSTFLGSPICVTPDWILSRYKDLAELAEKDSDKLRSLESLSKISGLFDTDTKQEQLTVWAGFSDAQMEALKDGDKAKLVAHKED